MPKECQTRAYLAPIRTTSHGFVPCAPLVTPELVRGDVHPIHRLVTRFTRIEAHVLAKDQYIPPRPLRRKEDPDERADIT